MTAPTRRQLAVARAIVHYGSQKAAAAALGVSLGTVKTHVTALIDATEAESFLNALDKLGWVHLGDPLPEPRRLCATVGLCTRSDEHRGPHGGFMPARDLIASIEGVLDAFPHDPEPHTPRGKAIERLRRSKEIK